jgi:hypothetical protein
MPMRESILLLGLVGFAVMMCLIVFGSNQFCTAAKSDHTATESIPFQFEFVSAKIAHCKKDGFDTSTPGTILPWLSVFFFPFLLLQFHNAFRLMRKIKSMRRHTNSSQTVHPKTRAVQKPAPSSEDNEEEQPLQDGTDATQDDDNVVESGMLEVTGQTIAIFVLESLAVGGYFWLVVWNHDDEHRNRHGVATGITFSSITFLNAILVWVYWRLDYNDPNARHCIPNFRRIVLLCLSLALIASVVIFGLTVIRAYDSTEAVAWEYIVIIIWLCIIAYQFLLGHRHYSSLKDDNKVPRKDWFWGTLIRYIALLAVGILLNLFILIWIPVV